MTPEGALQLAVQWAAKGVPVFPIALKWDNQKQGINKRPLTRNGFKDATTDPDQLRRQFNGASIRAGEEYGVGLWLGPANYFAVDVDVKNDAGGDDTIAMLEKEHGELPDTLRIVTASSGAHLWFRKPDGMTIGNGHNIGPGVDVRGDDGFVVAPGVSTPWGSWEPEALTATKPAEPPPWLLERLNAGNSTDGGRNWTGGQWQPVDDNNITPADRAALEALHRLGAHNPHVANGTIRVTRPGKTAGASATVGYLGPGVVKVFTSNWPPLINGAVYEADRLIELAEAFENGDIDEINRLANPVDLRPVADIIELRPRVVEVVEPVDEADTTQPATPYPLEIWPAVFGRFITETARSTSVAPEMVATLALPALATAIGATRYIRAKDDWTEYARVWAVVIAPPSVGKTPVGKAVRAPINGIQKDLDAIYASRLDQFEAEGSKGRRPEARHLVAQNVTVEALTEAMVGHPRGTLLYRDELTGWLQGMTQYKSGRGDDRQIFLEMWSGEPVRVMRKGKPPLIVHDPFLSIAGTTQPGRISELLQTDDGFAQRFLLCVPPTLPGDERAPAVSSATLAGWERLIKALYGLQGDDHGSVQLPWARGARDRMLDHLQQLRDYEAGDIPPALAQAAGKLRAYICRFALILACTHAAAGGDTPELVTMQTVDDARALADYYRAQAEAVYGEDSNLEPAPTHYRPVGPQTEQAILRALAKRSPVTLKKLMQSGPRAVRDADPQRISDLVGSMEARGFIALSRDLLPNGLTSVVIRKAA